LAFEDNTDKSEDSQSPCRKLSSKVDDLD